MEIFRLIREGGFVMYPLLACSVIVWGVALERWWVLHLFQKQLAQLYQQATRLLQDRKINEAKGIGHGTHPLLLSPYMALFEGEGKEERIVRKLTQTQMGLKRFLWILGTIGAAAPFIGLFGTVVGIIKSFDSIAQTGKSGFSVVAAGLSEALIATATGIIVAVIAIVFYNYFQNRLLRLNFDLKNKLEDLLEVYNRCH